jgi:hypothetical protein
MAIDSNDAVSHRILKAHAEEAVARLTAAEVISHSGERGMAREEILRQYLREIVPSGYEVSTGFVIDAAGGQSKQQDLIIVRRDYHPHFKIGAAHFFPVEAVSAVVEVKSTLNAATIKQAIENARSVKELDRTAGGRNYIPAPDGSQYLRATRNHDNHLVQAFIVAARSEPRAVSAAKSVQEAMNGHGRETWINGVAVAQDWYLTYDVPKGEPRTFPFVGSGIRLYRASRSDNVEPLLDVAHDLWWWLRASPIIDADPGAYIRTSADGEALPLPIEAGSSEE